MTGIETSSERYHVGWLGAVGVPETFCTKSGATIVIDVIEDEAGLERSLNEREEPFAVLFVPYIGAAAVPRALDLLRGDHAHDRTRVFLVSSESAPARVPFADSLDIEGVVDIGNMSEGAKRELIENGVRAFRTLGASAPVPRWYLDTTYHGVFEWFETTRWDWSEIDFSKLDRDLLTDFDIESLRELAIAEFGTLPAVHNFLREWADDVSFASWAVMWGAEEARHSVSQCRYLRLLGIEMPTKHAQYKREPYPMGKSRVGTLMMNIISETRASEAYTALSKRTREPVLKQIWRLIGRDEARHARVFHAFCKELVDLDRTNLVDALQMAYVWLADRKRGVKHPAGFFYPYSTSTQGLRTMEQTEASVTDVADSHVLAMVRNLAGDDSIRSVRDLKARFRELIR